MKAVLTLLALTLPSLVHAQSTDQHQIDFGFSDLYDFDEQFIGLSYTYAFEDLAMASGPHNLKSYLNKIDTVSTTAFYISDFYDIELDTTHYLDNNLVFKSEFSYARDKRDGDTFATLGATLGKNVTTDLQLGVGVKYLYEKNVYWSGEHDTDNAWRLSPYIRYTKVENGQGWDLTFKQVNGRENYYQGRANYYLNDSFFVGLVASAETGDLDNNNFEVQSQYWFGDHFALLFGLGTELSSDDSGLKSVTLKLTSRF